jgi:hypothetical protein
MTTTGYCIKRIDREAETTDFLFAPDMHWDDAFATPFTFEEAMSIFKVFTTYQGRDEHDLGITYSLHTYDELCRDGQIEE